MKAKKTGRGKGVWTRNVNFDKFLIHRGEQPNALSPALFQRRLSLNVIRRPGVVATLRIPQNHF
jgi:hypothetical protein